MNPLSRHYHQLVGLNQDWVIADGRAFTEGEVVTLSLPCEALRILPEETADAA